MKTSTLLKVGSWVQPRVPASHLHDRSVYGRVAAIETYTDDNGTRQWIYVRWYNDSGRPGSEADKHVDAELEELEEEPNVR